MRGQGAKRQCGQRATHIERAQVNREEAGGLDDLAHFNFRRGIIAGIEEHAVAARHFGLLQDIYVEVVEDLYDPGAWYELLDHLAGVLAPEIDRLDAVGRQQVAGVFCVRRVGINELCPPLSIW